MRLSIAMATPVFIGCVVGCIGCARPITQLDAVTNRGDAFDARWTNEFASRVRVTQPALDRCGDNFCACKVLCEVRAPRPTVASGQVLWVGWRGDPDGFGVLVSDDGAVDMCTYRDDDDGSTTLQLCRGELAEMGCSEIEWLQGCE
jgi:hypothetical protein